jgi:dihydroorotase
MHSSLKLAPSSNPSAQRDLKPPPTGECDRSLFYAPHLYIHEVEALYDLVVKNGTVIDPLQHLEGRRDIAVSAGKVVCVEEAIPSTARRVVDASGRIVTPGLIDLHTHVYWGGTPLGVDPDATCLAKGVTTVVDAGSAGCASFRGFRKFIIERSQTRVIPLLHISSIGLIKPPELEDLRYLDYDGAVAVAEANRDLIKGLKIRFASPPNNHVGLNGPHAMRLIREAADDTGGFIMVHPRSMSPGFPLEAILKLLRPGDVVTHCFAPTHPLYFPHAEILAEDGTVLPVVKEAVQRGILFDVGHGSSNFSFDTARKALADGFLPTTISTDLNTGALTTAQDLPTVMSKFLALGLSLPQVVERTTTNPAKVLGLAGTLGTLTPGAEADITILEEETGEFTFYDVRGNSLPGKHRLWPHTVIKGGAVVS